MSYMFLSIPEQLQKRLNLSEMFDPLEKYGPQENMCFVHVCPSAQQTKDAGRPCDQFDGSLRP